MRSIRLWVVPLLLPFVGAAAAGDRLAGTEKDLCLTYLAEKKKDVARVTIEFDSGLEIKCMVDYKKVSVSEVSVSVHSYGPDGRPASVEEADIESLKKLGERLPENMGKHDANDALQSLLAVLEAGFESGVRVFDLEK